MIPVSAAEKILDGKTFFVSTFLDKYNRTIPNLDFIPNKRKADLIFILFSLD